MRREATIDLRSAPGAPKKVFVSLTSRDPFPAVLYGKGALGVDDPGYQDLSRTITDWLGAAPNLKNIFEPRDQPISANTSPRVPVVATKADNKAEQEAPQLKTSLPRDQPST